jgi:hypothetical protein
MEREIKANWQNHGFTSAFNWYKYFTSGLAVAEAKGRSDIHPLAMIPPDLYYVQRFPRSGMTSSSRYFLGDA